MNRFKRFIESFNRSNSLHVLWIPFYRFAQLFVKCGPIATCPTIYFYYARHFKPGHFWHLPEPDTNLIIEGAGSCAMHGMAEYVKKHNPGLKVAYGCEVPATVLYGVRNRIPTLVLTRNLLGFTHSTVSRYPQSSKGTAMRAYLTFHRAVFPIMDRVVVSDFEKTRNQPQTVIRELNDFYGLSLNEGDNILPKIRHVQPSLEKPQRKGP